MLLNTSMVIQKFNEFIGALYRNLIEAASDFSRKEQVSVVLRYVDTDHTIQERLVNIECTDSTDAESPVQILLR